MTQTTTPVVTHWINGAEQLAHSTRRAPVYDPALGVVAKHVGLFTDEGVGGGASVTG